MPMTSRSAIPSAVAVRMAGTIGPATTRARAGHTPVAPKTKPASLAASSPAGADLAAASVYQSDRVSSVARTVTTHTAAGHNCPSAIARRTVPRENSDSSIAHTIRWKTSLLITCNAGYATAPKEGIRNA